MVHDAAAHRNCDSSLALIFGSSLARIFRESYGCRPVQSHTQQHAFDAQVQKIRRSQSCPAQGMVAPRITAGNVTRINVVSARTCCINAGLLCDDVVEFGVSGNLLRSGSGCCARVGRLCYLTRNKFGWGATSPHWLANLDGGRVATWPGCNKSAGVERIGQYRGRLIPPYQQVRGRGTN